MLRFLTALCLSLCTATAQDEARLLAEFTKAVQPGKGRSIAPDSAKQALGGLAAIDSPKTADVLMDGWLAADNEANAIDQGRQTHTAEMAELIKGQEASERRTFPSEKEKARFHHLKDLVQQQRTAIEALRELQTAIAQRVQALQNQDVLLFYLQKISGSRKHPLPLKLAAMRAVGAGAAGVMNELGTALTRAKEPEELMPLLEAMATAGTAVRAHAQLVIALLEHKEEAVRERAAQALAKIAVPGAIEPMIALLGRSSGQTRLRIAAALEVLTGQQFGINAGMWQNWWQGEGKALAGDGLGKGRPSKSKHGDRYYFGIPQDQSNSILYVIDCSGSMTKEVEVKLGEQTVTEKGSKTTRLEACKKELIRSLAMLRPEQRFAILWYNDLPHLWEPKIQPATKDSVARAQAFVQTLRPASSTNIYDSLKTCFGMVGRGVHDKYYGVELDTIFLLTDGSPTTPGGQLDSTEKIITAVREWNPLKRVTIHAIAIGRDLNASFLQQLARENGGEFKQY